MYREYRERFGSWNNAIKKAGFEPNPGLYVKRKFFANDGHSCDSFSEKIIDDWLFTHNVHHTRNVPYPNSKMTADFAVGDFRIEFFGLAGINKTYQKLLEKKLSFCKKHRIKLIELYPEILYADQKACLQKLVRALKTQRGSI